MKTGRTLHAARSSEASGPRPARVELLQAALAVMVEHLNRSSLILILVTVFALPINPIADFGRESSAAARWRSTAMDS
jgi:hypothetical protein